MYEPMMSILIQTTTVCVYTYMPAVTVSKKEAVNLKENGVEHMQGFGGRKGIREF